MQMIFRRIEDLEWFLDRNVRRFNHRIVTTNGCFDLRLNAAHRHLLFSARKMGDLLVVLVNTDASVRQLKGPGRPVICLEERLEAIQDIQWVEHVCAMTGDNPCHDIARIRPAIHVKGGDYNIDTLPETPIVQKFGGEAVTVPLIGCESTTDLIDRLQRWRP